MANADFSQKQNSTSGGFDAGSYREQKQPEQAVPLTPLQQKLAGLEAKLPAALSTRAAALALSESPTNRFTSTKAPAARRSVHLPWLSL